MKESKEWKLLAEHSGQLVSANEEETGGGSREEGYGETPDARRNVNRKDSGTKTDGDQTSMIGRDPSTSSRRHIYTFTSLVEAYLNR